MPEKRSSSADSRTSAGKSSSNSNSSSSSSSVFSKVLGSFRRSSSRDGDAVANSKEEDPNWANNYKITHYPDRPPHDKRAGLKHRNSVYVLGQLRKIWKHNGKMAEVKRRERAARERAFAAGMERSGGQGDERRRNEGGDGPGNLRAEAVSDVSHKPSSPGFAGNKWQASNEAHQHNFYATLANESDRKGKHQGRPASSPSSISGASDKMTIRVGLEVESANPYGGEESGGGGLKMRPGRTGGDILPPPPQLLPGPPSAPRFMTPLPGQSQSRSPFLSSEQKEAARRRYRRTTLPQSLQQQPIPAAVKTMQPWTSAREKALRESITPLQTATTSRDRTPELVTISTPSPASSQASPVTPGDSPALGPQTCPMPLCGNALRTAADREQNLCAECRSDLQPRQSIFRSDPILPIRTSTRGHVKPLAFHVRYNSTPEAGVKKHPETSRHINGESRTRTGNRGVRNRSVDGGRATIQSSLPQKEKSGNGPVASRFNRDRSQFALQPAPTNRKYTRRGAEPQIDSPSTGHQTARRRSGSPPCDETNDVDTNSHIGFQLAGWGTQTPNSSHQPLQRKPSGPLLEPKTFRPTTPIKRKNKDGSGIERRPSGSRRRAKGVNVRSGSGRALSSARTHVEKRYNHRATEPTPNTLPPRSPGPGRNRRQLKQHYSEQPTVGRGANVPDNRTGNEPNRQGINKKANPVVRKMARIDEDIYREIDNIIDCYLRVPGAPESENERRKQEAIASYFAEVPLDVEMKIKGFI
ncbi:hypothetical protein F4803DRAFT_132727 [Xylaria telfairii]|nr:hypothetical protein F4803DRAFT_132727 [Xylaria telfairii]